MLRADLELKLAEVEGYLASGERALLRQKKAIASLEGGGHASPQAREALEGKEQLQLLYVGERDRIQKQLFDLRD